MIESFHPKTKYPLLISAALLMIALSGLAARAESPNEIYSARVLPLLKSSAASSCSECHFQGVHLSDFLTEDPKQSFSSLRARGWIDIDSPSQSKILQFISRKPESSDDLISKVREAELAAITQWVTAAVNDPSFLNEPLPKNKDLDIDVDLIRHTRKDRLLDRFVATVWSQLERCANCHSPDRNQKQVEKNGEQMSWIVPSSPEQTLQLLVNRGLIDLTNPAQSEIRTKPAGLEKHGAGIKFPEGGQTDREWLTFLDDYVATVNAAYKSSKELPSFQFTRTWRTTLHLKATDLPVDWEGKYVVVFLYPKHSDGSLAKVPVAFGESRIVAGRKTWGNSLSLIDPRSLNHLSIPDSSAPLDLEEMMPKGTFEARWVATDEIKDSLETLLNKAPALITELEAPWKGGHSSALTVSLEQNQK